MANDKRIKYIILIVIAIIIQIFLLIIIRNYYKAEPFKDTGYSDDIVICDYRNLPKDVGKASSVNDKKDELWNYVVDNTKVPNISKVQLEKRRQENYKFYMQKAEEAGYTSLKEYLEKEMNITKKNLENYIEEISKIEIKEEMIAYYIAKKEGITVSDKEYSDQVNETLEIIGIPREKFKELYGMEFEEYCKRSRLKEQFVKKKVKDCIYKYNTNA